MVNQQIVGIVSGTNCVPPIADLFLFCYDSNFKSNLHESKQYDLKTRLTIPLDILRYIHHR